MKPRAFRCENKTRHDVDAGCIVFIIPTTTHSGPPETFWVFFFSCGSSNALRGRAIGQKPITLQRLSKKKNTFSMG